VHGDGAGLTPASFRFQREKGETVEVMMLTGGVRRVSLEGGLHCQREKGEEMVPVRGGGCWAVGSFWPWAEPFPGSISHFLLFSSFSFYLFFPISFIDFAKMLQITSNHFQRFCKIDCKVLNQYETSFQNQNNIFNRNID
jgi:hypothetical protein